MKEVTGLRKAMGFHLHIRNYQSSKGFGPPPLPKISKAMSPQEEHSKGYKPTRSRTSETFKGYEPIRGHKPPKHSKAAYKRSRTFKTLNSYNPTRGHEPPKHSKAVSPLEEHSKGYKPIRGNEPPKHSKAMSPQEVTNLQNLQRL